MIGAQNSIPGLLEQLRQNKMQAMQKPNVPIMRPMPIPVMKPRIPTFPARPMPSAFAPQIPARPTALGVQLSKNRLASQAY